MSTAILGAPAQRRAPRKPTGEKVLTRGQTVELCGFVDEDSIYHLLKQPGFPKPFYPFSRSPRWLRKDVERWLAIQARKAQESGS